MDRIFVDTNILIDYAKGKSDLLGKLLFDQAEGKVGLYINSVVISEYLTDENTKELSVLKQVINYIGFFNILPISRDEGIAAGRLMRDKKVLLIGDALIAATCLVFGLKLATRNTKHFKKVPKLKFCKLN